MAKVEKLNVSLELPIEMIKEMFDELCIHKHEYDKAFPESWIGCKKCLLSMMTWVVGNNELSVAPQSGIIVRDACFSIWHEGVLD